VRGVKRNRVINRAGRRNGQTIHTRRAEWAREQPLGVGGEAPGDVEW
jgi:hypothetical protein